MALIMDNSLFLSIGVLQHPAIPPELTCLGNNWNKWV